MALPVNSIYLHFSHTTGVHTETAFIALGKAAVHLKGTILCKDYHIHQLNTYLPSRNRNSYTTYVNDGISKDMLIRGKELKALTFMLILRLVS